MKIKYLLLIFLSLLNMYSSCIPRIYTPPARMWPNETPGSLGKGKNAVRFSGGAHLGDAGMGGFGFHAGSWTFAYHRGFTDLLEAGVQASMLIIDDAGWNVDKKPYVGNIRVTAKLSPEPVRRWLGFRSGLGLGFSDAGEFFCIDGGLILGFDNPYIVPFINTGMYVSFPFNTETVDFGVSFDDPYMPVGYADDPEITWGFESGLGFKLCPTGFSKQKEYKNSFSLYGISSITQCVAQYHEDIEWFYSFGGGIEFSF
jgi:hypothetical protein